MLNKIIRFSLDNRLIVVALSVVILVAGMFTLARTEVDIFPDLNAPTVVVMTEAPGMAPEEVEQLVTFPIETTMNGASGVRRVRSSSATGFSVVWVEFDWDSDVAQARQTVTERLSTIRGSLPAGVETPVLGPPSSILGEILIIGLTSDSIPQMELRSVADRAIRPALLSVSGVSQVAVIGGEIKEYLISLRQEKMRMFGVSLTDVIDALDNFNSNGSGGIFFDHDNEYLIKTTVVTSLIEEMEHTPVALSAEGNPVLLADIADVTLAPKLPEIGKASLNKKPAVLITVSKQPATGSIELTEKIIDVIDGLRKSLPQGIEINTEIFRQADFIGNSVSNLQSSLLEGAFFVIIVLFLFLMNFRTTLISAVAIPMSVIITLIILSALNLTINTMTLGGIAIAIGSLVDDAIVDVENVYRHLRLNRSLPVADRRPVREVVFEGSREVRMPILNSSLIIITSFLPLFFLDGIEGRMLVPLGISFIISLIASTIVALTLTPVLCLFLLARGKEETKLEKEPPVTRYLGEVYSRLLMKTVHKPKPLFFLTGVFLLAAALIFPFLGRSFLPSFNEGSFTVNVSALPGISLAMSDSIGSRAERLMQEVPEVILTARKTGRAELDEHSLGSNVSEIEVPYRLDKGRSKKEVMADIRSRLSALPGVNIEIGQPISHRIDAMLSGSEAQIAVKIFGDDLDRLYSIGKEVQECMQEVDGLVDINIEQQIPRPQIDIRPRRDMLARYGVTLPEFNRFVRVALGGETVSQVTGSALPYDITLRFSENSRNRIENLQDMMIDTGVGRVPLGYLADITSSSGPSTVNRENVSRRIVVSANIADGDLRGGVENLRKEVENKIRLPEGYSISYGGQFESEARASRTLLLASLGAIAVIFLLLYIEFKSISQSLVILLNMPLAIVGGVLILWLTGSEMNIPAIIGFISLLGISTRNGMLLISHYNSMKKDGISLEERLEKGSRDRLNPILMTALTSALALVPLALRGSSPGNEIQAPMATVILGGLLSSTLLNIFVVPAVYRLLEIKSTNLKNNHA
ncbi:MAG: CusA/CzcA family heavy metal efflux RND transporter [Muribaculaceae bacterium]|nr:CusA/CzcA family heavy metal efflux RND transporter [Muribaculaceae bacterium]